jgi:hypothetical protein
MRSEEDIKIELRDQEAELTSENLSQYRDAYYIEWLEGNISALKYVLNHQTNGRKNDILINNNINHAIDAVVDHNSGKKIMNKQPELETRAALSVNKDNRCSTSGCDKKGIFSVQGNLYCNECFNLFFGNKNPRNSQTILEKFKNHTVLLNSKNKDKNGPVQSSFTTPTYTPPKKEIKIAEVDYPYIFKTSSYRTSTQNTDIEDSMDTDLSREPGTSTAVMVI